jgi:ParB family chromosome partitioning protein
MARRSGLGKGLGALIPGEEEAEVPEGVALRQLPIESIRPNPFQPRAHFGEDSLDSLQPILVRPVVGEEGSYELIAGERRWRSARRAGLDLVPAIVQDRTTDLHSLEQALVENLHRADLNPLEEAAAYQQLIDEFDLTHDQVATRVGRSRVAVTNTLRLLQLPGPVQRAIVEGRLTAGHARALLAIDDPEVLEATAERVENEGLNVRATEELVRRISTPLAVAESTPVAPAEPVREGALPDAGITELEHLLERHLDTRVRVDLKGRRGRVIVEFADLDDLERIYRAITGVSST